MKEKLIGGMALPRGVLFMTEERLAAGYYDQEGQLRLYTQAVSLHRLRWAGRLVLLLFEAWRAVWRMEPDRVGANAVLVGAVCGLPVGIWLRSEALPAWVLFSICLALPALTCLLYPPFRQAVQQIRRYHAAEHMATHALMKTETDGLPTLAEVRPQPMLHPSCGTNLFMLLLPVTLLGYFLPYWLFLLLIPPFLHLFGWMNHHPEHPLARRLLALGYLGQRLTLAPPQDRELQAALKALEGLAAAVCERTVAEGSASTTLNQTSWQGAYQAVHRAEDGTETVLGMAASMRLSGRATRPTWSSWIRR